MKLNKIKKPKFKIEMPINVGGVLPNANTKRRHTNFSTGYDA